MDKKKKIVFKVNASSLVDLKAELYRKQESFKQEKIHQEQGLPTQRLPIKKPGLWNKQNVGVAERSEKDQKEKTEEELTLDKAREKLEEKAKLYDQMEKGGLPGEEAEEMFLVDFTQKFLDKQKDAVAQRGLREQEEAVGGPDEGTTRARHPNGLQEEEEELAKDEDIPAPSNPSEEWVDFVDSLGRSRRCLRKDLRDLQEMDKKLSGSRGPVAGERTLLSEDMRKEMERERWEKEQEELRAQPIGPIHYEHLREHEVRDLGVGYFAFSKDELKRKRQMDTLDMLRDQTLDQRSKREKLKEKRQAVLEARLERVRQRKGKKPGTDGPEGEMLDGEHLRAGSEPAEDVLQPGPSAGKVEVVVQVRRDTKKGEMPRVREWDQGKDFMLQDWQKGHGSQQRLPRDRPAEFAPPTNYFSGNKAGTLPSSERLPPPRMATQGPRTSDSSQHTPAQPPTQLDEMLAFYKQSNK
ncbi:coiled-coil domain-containing protein 174 [Lampetra planeri]